MTPDRERTTLLGVTYVNGRPIVDEKKTPMTPTPAQVRLMRSINDSIQACYLYGTKERGHRDVRFLALETTVNVCLRNGWIDTFGLRNDCLEVTSEGYRTLREEGP